MKIILSLVALTRQRLMGWHKMHVFRNLAKMLVSITYRKRVQVRIKNKFYIICNIDFSLKCIFIVFFRYALYFFIFENQNLRVSHFFVSGVTATKITYKAMTHLLPDVKEAHSNCFLPSSIDGKC